MTAGFPRGFKTEAETIALELRDELRLEHSGPLDPRALAQHFAIDVWSLDELEVRGVPRVLLRQLLVVDRSAVSAVTIFAGTSRLIVENPRHAPTRRASSLAHELAHVILEHEPAPVLSSVGTRSWNPEQEQQADWLGATILVPRPAALAIARSGEPHDDAAARYGVSVQLMQWRIRATGALLQSARESGRWRRRAQR